MNTKTSTATHGVMVNEALRDAVTPGLVFLALKLFLPKAGASDESTAYLGLLLGKGIQLLEEGRRSRLKKLGWGAQVEKKKRRKK